MPHGEDQQVPTYEMLSNGAGFRWFGDSWTVIARWLEAYETSGAQEGHKIWGVISLLSVATAHLRLDVFTPVTGVKRMNLASLFLGEQTAQTRAVIRTVREVAEQANIAFLPSDTGGNRLHLIKAMQGGSNEKSPKTKSTKEDPATEVAANWLFEHLRLAEEAAKQNAPQDPLEKFAQSESTKEPIDKILHPRVLISHNLQALVHSAYNDMTLLLAQCIAGEKIHIQTDRVYRLNDSAISLVAGSYFQGLVTRDGQVNADFLSQLLPIYCSSYVTEQGWEADRKRLTAFSEWFGEINHAAVPRHLYKLTEAALKGFERLRRYQLKTQELALSGYANNRPLTLLKIAGMLCFARRSDKINLNDLNLAHMLLLINEITIEICCIALHSQGTEARVWLTLVELIDKVGDVRSDEAMRYIMDRARLNARDAASVMDSLASRDRISVDNATNFLSLAKSGSHIGLSAFHAQLEMQANQVSKLRGGRDGGRDG